MAIARTLTSSAMRLAALALTVVALDASAAEPAAASPTASARLRADGTRFALQAADGRTLHSHDLVGAQMHLAGGRTVRIDAVEERQDHRGKPLWLHRMSVLGDDDRWVDFCQPHSDGTRHALLVPGRERGDGTIAHDDDGGAYTLTCTAGAQAKCVRFGYRPWEPGMRATYNACVRMVRADYGGAGRPYTENGRLIDLYDPLRVQVADMAPDQRFEAGWDEHGAVCVHHVRVAENATLEALEARYPRLRGATGVACTEDVARERGALIFNRSTPAAPAAPARAE